jgi:hypothetical protein
MENIGVRPTTFLPQAIYNRSLENTSLQFKRCPTRERLIAELLNAHSSLAELNDRDVQCILRGDLEGSAALANELDDARARRERALEAIHTHLAEHGCQDGNGDLVEGAQDSDSSGKLPVGEW